MRFVICFVICLFHFQKSNCFNGALFRKETDFENSRLNFFDTDLLRYFAEDKKINVIISPASIKSLLAMILEGAHGGTANEIRSALRLSPRKDEFREELNKYLLALQTNSPGVFLQNSNGVFVSNRLKLKREYEIMLRRVYLTEIGATDFSNPTVAANVINNWVNMKTKGLIPYIVDSVHINPTAGLIMTNALYFKSDWRHAFDPRSTHAACFYNRGVCKNVAMMELYQDLKYAYVDDLRAHAVELPYQDSRYSMIVLLPRERDGVHALIRDLPYVNIPQIVKLMEITEVQLSMPKFTVDFNEDLVAVLRNLKITSLFSPTANLSGIFDGDAAQINGILHRVHFSMDEAGTVVAAASSAMVIPLIQSGVQITVDHPFLFFIKDNNLGLILVEGKIEEPTAYDALYNDDKIIKGKRGQYFN